MLTGQQQSNYPTMLQQSAMRVISLERCQQYGQEYIDAQVDTGDEELILDERTLCFGDVYGSTSVCFVSNLIIYYISI